MTVESECISRQSYRFALIDDEIFYHARMKDILMRFFPESTVDCYFSVDELLMSNLEYSLLFVDVLLNGTNAIEMSGRMRAIAPFIVYYSAAKENLRLAFGCNVVGFIFKTDSDEEIWKQLVRIEQRYLSETIVLRILNGETRMNLSKIVYFEKQGRRIFVHSINRTCVQVLDPLKEIQKKTNGKLIYANRSVLINPDHIRSIKDNYVYLSDGKAMDMSRRAKKSVETAFIGRFL